MITPRKLQLGDKVAIISLSSGILGEPFAIHSLELGIKRLKEFGLEPVFMKNSLSGIKFVKNNPERRAMDLIDAFSDTEIKAIICSIGGDDTFKTLEFLMNNKFQKIIQSNPKIFIGYSDSTINHLMFYKFGLKTFYGHSFIVDFAELDNEMLDYSKRSFENLFNPQECFEIKSSPIWYEERKDFSSKQLGITRNYHVEKNGYEVIYGSKKIIGELFGGCLDTFYEIFFGERYFNQKKVCEQYDLLPQLEEWKDKILFLETSEEKPSPEKVMKTLEEFKRRGILRNISGIIFGKPQDEVFYNEYKKILTKIGEENNIPILFNLNFGHSHPKIIIPYGAKTQIDFENKKFTILENIVK